MMSDQNMGKKQVERMDLDYFVEAYEHTTCIKIDNIYSSETPDFIWIQDDSGLVGIELTQVRRAPEAMWWDRVIDRKESMDGYEAAEEIARLVEKKDVQMRKRAGDLAGCILVVQLVDCPIEEVVPYLDPSDYVGTAFSEIWMGSYADVVPYSDGTYGQIELFGLYPQAWWGHHHRDRGKPYG